MPSATTSNFLFKKQMDYLLKNAAADWRPATIYIGLLKSAVSIPAQLVEGFALQEVSTAATGYTRQPVSAWTGPGADANITYSNTADIVFGTPTANWGTIYGAALYDSDQPTANLLFISELTTAKTVNNGDGAPKILAGQLRISRATCP